MAPNDPPPHRSAANSAAAATAATSAAAAVAAAAAAAARAAATLGAAATDACNTLYQAKITPVQAVKFWRRLATLQQPQSSSPVRHRHT